MTMYHICSGPQLSLNRDRDCLSSDYPPHIMVYTALFCHVPFPDRESVIGRSSPRRAFPWLCSRLDSLPRAESCRVVAGEHCPKPTDYTERSHDGAPDEAFTFCSRIQGLVQGRRLPTLSSYAAHAALRYLSASLLRSLAFSIPRPTITISVPSLPITSFGVLHCCPKPSLVLQSPCAPSGGRLTPGVNDRNVSSDCVFNDRWAIKPTTNSRSSRATSKHVEVYSSVIRLPSLLICANRSKPLA